MKIPKDKLPVITNEMFVSWCNLYNHLYNDLDQHGETLLEDMVKHFEKQINLIPERPFSNYFEGFFRWVGV